MDLPAAQMHRGPVECHYGERKALDGQGGVGDCRPRRRLLQPLYGERSLTGGPVLRDQLHARRDHRRRQHLTPGHRELRNQRHLFADRNRDRQGRRHGANLCLGVLRHPNPMDALRRKL